MLKINGREVSAEVVGISRSIRREEKYRVTCEDGRAHSELRARYLDFTLELGGFDKAEYDALLAEISSGEAVIELDGEEFVGLFDSIADEVLYEGADGYYWDNLSLSFSGTRHWEEGV